MAFNRVPFVNISPKMETVFEKMSIQREYRLKQSSTDALNLSQTSTPNDGVTSDSFIPHGFFDQKPQNPPKSEEKPTSLQSEDTISSYEREIQKMSDDLCEFIADAADTGVRCGKQVNHLFNTASEASTQPTSKTTLFKSFLERSRDAYGESTTQEFSSQQGFDERGIDEALAGKELFAHSTKKLPASTSEDPDSSLKKAYLYSDSKGASRDKFARYGNASDATRRSCKPYMCCILILLALLLALFIAGLVWYLLKEKRLDDCLEKLKQPLEDFCLKKPPAIRLDLNKMVKPASNSENSKTMKIIHDAMCSMSGDEIAWATNRTRTLLDSVNVNLWPTVGDIMYFKPLFLGEPICFNVSAKEAHATIQLLRLTTFENAYLPAMQKALEALEYSKNDPDNRNWMELEYEFFEAAEGEKTLSSETVNTTVISFEGSPRELYWSLRLATRCKRMGDTEVNYLTYRDKLNQILEKMTC